ncbi:Mitochondrial substrate carrier family protein, partial [Thalictrum thalictroides]
TFPLDLVRRRMQLEGARGRARVYKTGLFGTFGHIMQTEGLCGLYRGTLVLLIITPSIIMDHQCGSWSNAMYHGQNQGFRMKGRQILFDRQLQEASPPFANDDKDDPLVQPDGGNRHGAGGGNHHGVDLQTWDKQHPKPPLEINKVRA